MLSRRDQGLACLGGVLADIDGAGAVIDLLQGRRPGDEGPWFAAGHHIFGHNLLAGLVICGLLAAPARDRPRTFAWALGAFHLHLVCDLLGSRGPDGEIWGIPYGLPLTFGELAWSGQWALNAWPNLAVTLLGLVVLLGCARRRGFSPLAFLSAAADGALVATLRARFPLPTAPESAGEEAGAPPRGPDPGR